MGQTLIDENTRLLILSPHPDDEILGCGGLIAKVKRKRGIVDVVYFTYGDQPEGEKIREEETRMIQEFYEIDNMECLYSNVYHLKLDKLLKYDIIQQIEKVINQYGPNIIAIPFPSFNQDHAIVYETAISALRSSGSQARHVPDITLVYEYPQAGWGGGQLVFQPNVYIDISDEIAKKMDGFEIYKSQNKCAQYAISSEGVRCLAAFRGKEITVDYAEAYMMKKGIYR